MKDNAEYVDVHVGIVGTDPDHPVTDLLDTLPASTQWGPCQFLFDGDSWAEWGEPYDRDSNDPLHVVVRIPRDYRMHTYYETRRICAAMARATVRLILLDATGNFRLTDYVAVDFDPTWGEDQAIVSAWDR